MLVAVSVLAISLSILLYHHPPSTWRAWLSPVPSPQRGSAEHAPPVKEQHAEPQAQTDPEPIESSLSSPSPQTTPKAVPNGSQDGVAAPTFTLAAHESSDEDEDDLPPPSFPAMNSAQRAAPPMAPPPRPAVASLMPPPQAKPSNLRALPTLAPSLRVPTTDPLPNRGPVPNRNPNAGLGVPIAAGSALKTPNARGKVLLSPGHSPLDWASLQRSGKNLSGVQSLTRVTPAMLKHNNGRKGKPAWSSYQGKVYNITPYLPFHPGGEGELKRAAGKDGGKLFMEVHPWVNWENMLGECMVGIMVAGELAPELTTESLEDMD